MKTAAEIHHAAMRAAPEARDWPDLLDRTTEALDEQREWIATELYATAIEEFGLTAPDAAQAFAAWQAKAKETTG